MPVMSDREDFLGFIDLHDILDVLVTHYEEVCAPVRVRGVQRVPNGGGGGGDAAMAPPRATVGRPENSSAGGGGGVTWTPAEGGGGGGLEKWGSVPGPLFCVRTDVGAEGARTQMLAQKSFFHQ